MLPAEGYSLGDFTTDFLVCAVNDGGWCVVVADSDNNADRCRQKSS